MNNDSLNESLCLMPSIPLWAPSSGKGTLTIGGRYALMW